ncbi:substrate-binding domain-containing protein [Aeromicrobium sp. S22]|uniref:LacI family DNA-binding transcriptional regulator n=1 Tax=Aeromicrobium sp. S22 TaxID=2662029 RepID=UPI00129E83AD|nr:LacI family DNA-binding transcriptional regulator [Aeromicrobium sp. S22]MRK03253.1 substrate-binding domain-containing protein [Aeromicrobium sp. S22]
MAHPYRLREIAQQSGLSLATVDRVVNHRPGVRPSTVKEVQQAIAELDRQAGQVRIAGRTFIVDLVMQTPERFSSAVRAALEAELPHLRPAVVRSRFHLQEASSVADVVRTLARIARRGSHGVILKAPDAPEVVAAVDDLVERGIPVVTLVTDLPGSRRVAYVGIDNHAAGATAAYLVTQWGARGSVLMTLSSADFRGEGDRGDGFRRTMAALAPGRVVREVAGTDGLDATMLRAVTRALVADPSIDAVYSIGGGNVATLDAFAHAGRECRVLVAHDLDDDNAVLLRQHQLSAVLHHDLRDDMRRACRAVMQAHGALPGPIRSVPSPVHVVTPYNAPAAFHPHR